MISKILLQKSKDKMDDYIIEMIASNLTDDWKYINYVNGEEIKFFNENPLEEFPDIVAKFNSIVLQPHKADLFRYYYLYINGGVYLDSDAMLHDNIMNIIREYDFVSVISHYPNSIFNGFIATIPKHPIMYKALQNMYNANHKLLSTNYHTPGKFLYDLINKNKYDNIFLYREYMNSGVGYTYNNDRVCVIIHYPITKVIPKLKDGDKLVPFKIGWTPSILKKIAYFKK